jgi:negative regulator of sigma E activity
VFGSQCYIIYKLIDQFDFSVDAARRGCGTGTVLAQSRAWGGWTNHEGLAERLLFATVRALLHKSSDGRTCPFPGQTQWIPRRANRLASVSDNGIVAVITCSIPDGSTTCHMFSQGLMNLAIYIEQNSCSIANYGERYRAGKRIAATAAEASVNSLIARRMVKKQQMRWTEKGANLLLQVRVAIANGNLKERFAYQSPVQSKLPVISPFVAVPLFQRAA